MPAKFRSSLTDEVVLSRGTEQCLTIWPQRDFEAFVSSSLEQMHQLDPRRDKLKRYFFANSFETELDSAGRVGIPAALMTRAKLSKEVVVNGVDDRIEVWDRETWAAYNDDLDIGELMAEFTGFGGPTA